MKISLFCIIAIFIIHYASAQEQEVDALFERYNSPEKAGAAIAIIQNSQISYSKGYGSSDLENRRPITPDTVFDVASVSKQYTAMAIALAAQEGLLSLSDPISKYIPGLNTTATIKQIIHHIGGLNDYVLLHLLNGDGFSYTPAATVDILKRQKPLFPAGARWSYCNSGYFLLSVVIERSPH